MFAQDEAPAAQTTTLRVSARLVVLDVSAVDASGKPITGLTAADFQVYEDKAPQQIQTFEAESNHALPAAVEAEGAAGVFDPAMPATFGSSPVTVLVLDQLNTHFADSSFARRQLHDYLQKQPAVLRQPATLLTLYQNHFKQLAGFTRDRDSLLKAMAGAPVEYAWTLEGSGKADHGPIERLELSLNALQEIAQSYGGIRGRKNLLWVGSGFPSVDPANMAGQDYGEVRDTLKHVTDVLLTNRVTLYAVDPSSTLPGMSEIIDATQQQFVMAGGDSGASGSLDTFGVNDDFDKLGLVSGGSVVRGRNDVSELISDAVNAGTHYYTLSYSPSSANDASAAYRKIRVECLKLGCTASTRQGYFPAAAGEATTKTTIANDLSAAAETSMPLHALHVTIGQGSATTEQDERFSVKVSLPGLTWTPQGDGSSKASVQVMAVSLDRNGHANAHKVSAESADAKAGVNLNDASKTATFVMMTSPSAKAVTLRFVVRDAASGRMGSADVPVDKK